MKTHPDPKKTTPRRREPTKIKTKFLGCLGVDTATLVLADPCQLDEVTATVNSGKTGAKDYKLVGARGCASGLVLCPGSDGLYPVLGDFVKTPYGERLVAVWIDLDPHCYAQLE